MKFKNLTIKPFDWVEPVSVGFNVTRMTEDNSPTGEAFVGAIAVMARKGEKDFGAFIMEVNCIDPTLKGCVKQMIDLVDTYFICGYQSSIQVLYSDDGEVQNVELDDLFDTGDCECEGCKLMEQMTDKREKNNE